MKIEKKIPDIRPELQKELINILMDSELYLSLPLEERYLLLNFILDSYPFLASIESKKDPSQLIWNRSVLFNERSPLGKWTKGSRHYFLMREGSVWWCFSISSMVIPTRALSNAKSYLHFEGGKDRICSEGLSRLFKFFLEHCQKDEDIGICEPWAGAGFRPHFCHANP